MLLECKQCGGQVPCGEGVTVAVCPYCGSQNTIGKQAAEQGGLVNRANYLRRNNEFDKAAAAYEELLRADNTDYEAHWGLVLCKYGIEYVEDPATGAKKPTCHRTYPDSVLVDSAYQAALEYAPLDVREVYEREAAEIDAIQKSIIVRSKSEEQYDVFLCYKELDESSNRTPDSVIAQELEFELSRRGYRVFFARKTLERALGSEYEPIIYAALQSARAMVVLGTKQEHFNAVWVRNEWSRYRELIKKGAEKILIPAYRGMSPYDLPLELSNLQALDMSKLGFVQDLCDGIDRYTRAAKQAQVPAAAGISTAGGVNTETLLKRAFLFLEEGSFQKAEDYLERILDLCPEEPRAYLGKLMVEFGAKREQELANATGRIDYSSNFVNVKKFGDESLIARLSGYAENTEAVARAAERKKKEQADLQARFLGQVNQEVRACGDRMPSGSSGIWLGALLLTVGLILWAVTLKNADGLDELGGAMLSILLYCLPGTIFLSIGISRREMRTAYGKYSGRIQHGVEIRALAQAAGLGELAMAKILNNLIQKEYLQHAYQQGGKLLFRLSGASAGMTVMSQAGLNAAQDRNGSASKQVFKDESQQYWDTTGAVSAGMSVTAQAGLYAAQDRNGSASKQVFKDESQQYGIIPKQYSAESAAREIQDCLMRMPSGSAAMGIGIVLLMGAAVVIFAVIVPRSGYMDDSGGVGTVVSMLLTELPALIFTSTGRTRKERKKLLEKTCGELARGASIIQAARAAKIPALKLEKTLTHVINNGYLRNASLQNNTLKFGTKWPE